MCDVCYAASDGTYEKLMQETAKKIENEPAVVLYNTGQQNTHYAANKISEQYRP